MAKKCRGGAKFWGSPFGIISGTLYGVTASRARGGVLYLKEYFPYIPQGSRAYISRALSGEIPLSKVSFKQANVVRIFTFLIGLAKRLRPFIYSCWEPMVRGTPLTGWNKFVKVNHPRLYHSIPNVREIMGPGNKPDATRLLITDGRNEPGNIISCRYESGVVKVEWDTYCDSTGRAEDEAILVALYWELPNSLLEVQANFKVWVKEQAGVRSDGKGEIEIGSLSLLGSGSLTVYLIFKSTHKYFGYSPSSSYKLLS